MWLQQKQRSGQFRTGRRGAANYTNKGIGGAAIASLQLKYSHLLYSAISAISKTDKLVQQALLYQSTPMQFGFMQTGG